MSLSANRRKPALVIWVSLINKCFVSVLPRSSVNSRLEKLSTDEF